MLKLNYFVIFLVVLCAVGLSCNGDGDGADEDAGAGGDTDTDTDADTDTDSDTGSDAGADAAVLPPGELDLEWITIEGATYLMGSDANYEADEAPVHEVAVQTFDMTKSEVTVADYQRCVDSRACSAPKTQAECNWKFIEQRKDHPVNCVKWQQAVDFCEWVGGRLPTEAEWEFAARSRDKRWVFTWDHTTKTGDYCDYAVLDTSGKGKSGCLEERTWPVCNKTEGNTEQGLCDMCGNVEEFTQDHRHLSYVGAPTDGRPWIDEDKPNANRITRGGNYYNVWQGIRVANRYSYGPNETSPRGGFRCARSDHEYGPWDGSGAVELHDLTCEDFKDGWNNRLMINGKARSFVLNLPDGVEDGGPWPVIFNWHGLGDTASNFSLLVSGEVN
ncbi:MAG: formylglycine-generating enzyme family protein, partial [bacterium]|nr:formylglycine-generating enzyme family protein [bacterium]